jgi:hypothetical protein
LFVNGSEVTYQSYTAPSLNQNSQTNLAQPTLIGANFNGPVQFLDGYLTEVNFIDGQGLPASSFGSTNALTGVWQPAAYVGTYGTNGFYLPFTDNSALTTSSNVGLGRDYSGNGNYWTTNNISITAGVTYDSMTDVPTLTSATASNYCVLNPLKINATNPPTFSNSNLQTLTAATNFGITFGTIGVSTGKFYWEITPTSVTGGGLIGVANDSAALDQFLGQNVNGWSYYNDGNKYTNNTATAYGASFVANDVIGVALDMSAGTVVFYKNNTSQGTAFTGLTGTLFPAMSDGSGSGTATFVANFGQRPFAYTPPTGFVALNTFNLPAATIVKGNTVMDATLYTGTGAALSVTNAAGFQPDLVWAKSRSNATNHQLTDSVRGTTKSLVSNSGLVEATDTQGLTAFNSNGFALGTDVNYNGSARTFVGWQWQAGQGTTSSNTDGTITSQVSVNPSAGFSVVTYNGTGANATVGHGLGVAPSMVIVKARESANVWRVGHKDLTSWAYSLQLNDTAAEASNVAIFNSTAPTSTVFSVGTSVTTNESAKGMVAYCFAPIAGYSAIGAYQGNGNANGTFVYLGFRPKFVMLKRSGISDWTILDSAREGYNVSNDALFANLSNTEGTSTVADLLSNGFKLRTSGVSVNELDRKVLYIAFAENPFRHSLAR